MINMKDTKPYLSKQIITYMGNKRKLLPHINSVIEDIKTRLRTNELVCGDGFSFDSNNPYRHYLDIFKTSGSWDLGNLQSIVLYQGDSRMRGCVIELINGDTVIYNTKTFPAHSENSVIASTKGQNWSIRVDGPVTFTNKYNEVATTDPTWTFIQNRPYESNIINNPTQTLVYTIDLNDPNYGSNNDPTLVGNQI